MRFLIGQKQRYYPYHCHNNNSNYNNHLISSCFSTLQQRGQQQQQQCRQVSLSRAQQIMYRWNHYHYHHHNRYLFTASFSLSSSVSSSSLLSLRMFSSSNNNNNNNNEQDAILRALQNVRNADTKKKSSPTQQQQQQPFKSKYDDNTNNDTSTRRGRSVPSTTTTATTAATAKKQRKQRKQQRVTTLDDFFENIKLTKTTTTTTTTTNQQKKKHDNKNNNQNTTNSKAASILSSISSSLDDKKENSQQQQQQQPSLPTRTSRLFKNDNIIHDNNDAMGSIQSSNNMDDDSNNNNSGTIGEKLSSSSSSSSRTGLSSFFKEVDAIVQQRVANNNKNNNNKGRFGVGNVGSVGDDGGSGPHATVPKKSLFDVVGGGGAGAGSSTNSNSTTPHDSITNHAYYYFDNDDNDNDDDDDESLYSYKEYLKLLETVMEQPKFLKRHVNDTTNTRLEKDEDAISVIEWLCSKEPVIPCHLPTLDQALKDTTTTTNTTTSGGNGNNDKTTTISGQQEQQQQQQQQQQSLSFQKEIQNQKEALMNHYGWNPKQYTTAVGALYQIGGYCVKNATSTPLEIAWPKLKEAGGFLFNQGLLTNYLYVASSFFLHNQQQSLSLSKEGERGVSVLDFLYDTPSSSSSSSSNNTKNNKHNDATGAPSSSSSNQGNANENEGKDEEEADDSNKVVDLACEIATCHDLLLEPSEQSTSIRSRMLVSLGKPNEAEQLLDSVSTGDELRLRAYTPVFQAYLNRGDVLSAFQLFEKMKKAKNVSMQTDTYIQLIAGVAEHGYFRHDSKPIAGIQNLGYSVECGPELFDLLALQLADSSVEISSASAKRLYNALQSGFEGYNGGGGGSGDSDEDGDKNQSGENTSSSPSSSRYDCNLERLHILQSVQPCNEMAKPNELVASRVTLDPTNGKCPRTGVTLRLINLNAEQKRQLQDGLVYLSATSYEERFKKKNSKAEQELRRFGEWLRNREGDPFTAIIDGPNVAYYMQNFHQGTFNFHQIQFVVETLENMGETVLVILPEKYSRNSFSLTVGTESTSSYKQQRLTPAEIKIRQDLISSGKAYIVPTGCLDDYHWMYASVSDQGITSSKNKNNDDGNDNDNDDGDDDFMMYIPPDNPQGRWPGIRPMLISNDKMRDHKLSLLEPRLFRRWYSNFMVNFTFSAFVGDKCTDKEIGFKTADFYSREIQGNSTTAMMMIIDDNNGNDEHQKNGRDCGTAWHFPVSDWNENESFCIRIPK